ncbi:TPA: hypothetical protein RFT82_003107 [Klebsiella aerogenes]|nr:hypothetical protein [Klebsiella aerogenes]
MKAPPPVTMSSVWLALTVFSIPIAISILCCLKKYRPGNRRDPRHEKQRIYAAISANYQQTAEDNKIDKRRDRGNGQKKNRHVTGGE